MFWVRAAFVSVLCVSLSLNVLADDPPYRTVTTGNGRVVTTTGQTAGSGTGGGVNTDKCTEADVAKKTRCGGAKGVGHCGRVEGKPSCIMSSCTEPYYLEYKNSRELEKDGTCRNAESAGKMKEGWHVCVSGNKNICRTEDAVTKLCSTPTPKGWFSKKKQEGEPKDWAANVITLDSGTKVIAGCKNINKSVKRCKTEGESAEVLDRMFKVCLPCKRCEPDENSAYCKLVGSDGNMICYYETGCKDGFDKEDHHGEYNPVCYPKQQATEPQRTECTPTELDALGASEGKFTEGKCIATKCKSNTAIIENGACQECEPCKKTNAICELSVQNNKCVYTTTCESEEYEIQQNGRPDASCLKKQKPVVAPEPVPEPDVKPCDKTELNAETVEQDEGTGECKITRCANGYILEDGKCKKCQECQPGAHAKCKETGSDGLQKCTYETSCDGGYHPTENENQYNPQCEQDAPDEYAIEYVLDEGAGCEQEPKKYKVGTKTVVNCVPTKPEYKVGTWMLDEEKITMPYTIDEKATGDKIFTVVWELVCTDDEKAKYEHADEFEVKDDKCVPKHCEKGYKLENNKCVDDGIKKAEDDYKEAKDTENSFENRMLGGTTMAATGLGGMQLAQGLAEQSADAAAERDMQAYLATFKCKVGDKWYSGGTTNAETGGANQLTSLYQEYVDLASDLKTRKEALGLKPGIESEVKLDKAYTGLYDNAGKGTENGTYASLYRASRGNENDINKLNEQKETSGTMVKGGGIAAGGGALAGVAGNLLINHTGDGTDGDSQSIDAETVMKTIQSMQK